MPLTSYCKKCARDVPVGERCPHCGSKLPANTVRLAWCVDHTPLKDWMSWNAVMRVAIPVLVLALLIVVALEGVTGGAAGVEALFREGLTLSLLGVSVLGLAVLLLLFILQGDDILDCVVDSKGFHVQQYLPEPTPLKLLARLKSPTLMSRVSADNPMLLLSQREIAWKDIARVQLWPEKTLLLLYAPVWWLRLAVPCTPFTWEDALNLVSDKLGRKKAVDLPKQLVAPPKPKAPKPVKARQMTIEDIPPVQEETAERPEDFVPLMDVLQEIRDAERSEEA
ncbi:MAG: hypothetical protein J1E43_03850 [Christensenellaceae bacterium]|nr:hypothetical protein [Christensenellaceae bacterium]